MNFDKRYCQNRVQKRKKVLKNTSPERRNSSMEVDRRFAYQLNVMDERQFKLNRFVKDVTKFIENKGHLNDQKGLVADIGSPLKKTAKRTKPANLRRRGLFQNGIQTKFYSRGVFGKDLTARLDEDLQQIISLANKENDQSLHNNRRQVDEPKVNEPPRLAAQCMQQTRASSHCSSNQTSPSTHCVRMDQGDLCTENDKSPSFLEKLDSKLYPEFTRIVTLSSIESKSIQFGNKSYVAAVKRKLLDIYQQRSKEINEELSCPSDVQKSSVATSPLRSPSPSTEPQPWSNNPLTQGTSDSEQGFDFIQFIPEPLKSTSQFLEETIGPRSSCKSVETSTGPCEGMSSSIPLVPCQKDVLPRRLEHYEPLPRVSSIPSSYNLMMPFDGGGDRLFANSNNLFLPTYEESPEFQYFPRRMF